MPEAKTVLLTGGAGFIGSALARRMVDDGWQVINLDALTYAGNPENLSDLDGNSAHHFVHGSICDGALVRALIAKHAPDAIINVAAETHVDRSIDSPAAFIETNINGTFMLLGMARDYVEMGKAPDDFRYLQVSTDEVYGSVDTGASVEADPCRANSPYAASKAAADMLVRSYYKTYGLATVVTHGSNTYGPRQFPEKLLPVVIVSALEGRDLPIYGDGTNVRDWLNVDDHAAGIVAALTRGQPGEHYNIGGNNELTNIDIVKKICGALDAARPRNDGVPYEKQIAFVADRPGHDRRYALDTSKAASALNWSPVVEFETGLAATVAWFAERWQMSKREGRSLHDGTRIGLGNNG